MMRENKTTLIVILGFFVILGVVGFVVFSGKGPAVTEQPAQVDSEMLAADIQDTAGPIAEAIKTEDKNTETAVPVEEEVIVPVVKKDLEATNPGGVNLASGDVQLIEFFAFW